MEQEEGGHWAVPVGRNINTPIAFILLLHGIPPVIQASNFPEISEKLEHWWWVDCKLKLSACDHLDMDDTTDQTAPSLGA